MAPSNNPKMIRLDVRITLFLVRPTRMGNSAIHRRPNLLGVFPQRSRCVVCLSGAPFGLTFGEFSVAQFYVKSPGNGVDLDDIAVLDQGDRPA
jgi:hypothetical protein